MAGFGAAAGWLEDRAYADDQAAGVHYVAVLVGATAGAGALVSRACAQHPISRVLVTAGRTWAVLGGRSLRREATLVAGQLEAGDLPAARRQVRNLVGRDPAELSAEEVARATVESVAENTSDAVVAPLLWGAVGGLPGSSATAPSTPSTPWSGTAHRAISSSAGPPPASTTSSTGSPPGSAGSPPRSGRRWSADRRGTPYGPSPTARGGTRAPMPAWSRPPSRARWASGSAGATSTTGRPRTAASSATGRAAEIADIARANRLAAAVSITGLLAAVLIQDGSAMTVLILGGTAEARSSPRC